MSKNLPRYPSSAPGILAATASMLVGCAIAFGACAGSSGGTGGIGGTGAGGGQTTSTGGGGESVWLFDAGSDAQSDGGGLSGCATASAKAKLLPLDMYIMLDQSGSMIGAKWSAVTQALDTFVHGDAVADLGAGLQYFPLPGAAVCDYLAYATPAVPIAPLAQSAADVSTSLVQHAPSGETPTLSALQGALSYTKAWAKSNPTHTVVVVLATDGEPNVCGSTIANVSQAAQVGFTTSPSIRTFVIGVGTVLSSLDAIAAAGGTDKAILVDDSAQSTEQEFVAALATIRGSALPCEYEIPPPPEGEKLDFGKVNVVRTPTAGEPSVIPRVATPADCAGAPESWYYDNPASPTKVVLCDAMCAKVKSDSEASIDIVFGCATEIAK